MIKQRRLELGLSITELAEKLSISRPQASRLENGKSGITAEMAVKIEEAIGVSRAVLRPDLFIIAGCVCPSLTASKGGCQ